MTLFVVASILTTTIIVDSNPKVFAETNKAMIVIIIALTIIMISCAFWLVYSKIYGILTKRLDRNYKDLKKIES